MNKNDKKEKNWEYLKASFSNIQLAVITYHCRE